MPEVEKYTNVLASDFDIETAFLGHSSLLHIQILCYLSSRRNRGVMTVHWKASVVTFKMPLNLYRQPTVIIKIAFSETSVSAIFVLLSSRNKNI